MQWRRGRKFWNTGRAASSGERGEGKPADDRQGQCVPGDRRGMRAHTGRQGECDGKTQNKARDKTRRRRKPEQVAGRRGMGRVLGLTRQEGHKMGAEKLSLQAKKGPKGPEGPGEAIMTPRQAVSRPLSASTEGNTQQICLFYICSQPLLWLCICVTHF